MNTSNRPDDTTPDALPFTVLVPDNATAPIEMYDSTAALHIAVVERNGVKSLPDLWDGAGLYVLLDPKDSDSWGVYVGKAPTGIRTRVKQHVKHKDHWDRAVLITRDTTFGFNSAQIGWLEGRFYDLFQASASGELHNSVRPSDENLPPYDRQMLELVVLPVSRVLRLIGYDPATPDDETTANGPSHTARFYGVTVADLIDAGLIDIGTQLVSTNGAWPATAQVVAGGDIETGGKTYPTPSAASAAIKGGASNGWAFWAIETPTGKVTLATLRARHIAQRERST